MVKRNVTCLLRLSATAVVPGELSKGLCKFEVISTILITPDHRVSTGIRSSKSYGTVPIRGLT